MTKEEFIRKWVVAYESKEQQIEFANEMKADLDGLVELHPSITHINAKNLKPETVKMINKMVEKAIEMEISRTKKQKVFEISAFMSGFTGSKDRTKGVMDFLDDYLCDDLCDDSADLTAENTRLREALKSIEKVAINSTEMEYEDDLDYIADVAIQALNPDNSK